MVVLLDRNIDELMFSSPEPGCVSYLPGLPGGGSKIYDRSPYGNISTIVGATWVRQPSGLWCLSFDGGDDMVDITANAALQMGAGDWSATAWINITTGVGLYCAVMAFDNDGIVFRIGEPCLMQDGDAVKGSGGAWTTGIWYQVAATRTGTTYIMYKDGVDVSSAQSQVGYNIAGKYYISRGNASYFYKGLIALPRIYNRVLTAFEIQKHFNQEKNLFGVW